MVDITINEILKKHGINDENLAKALAEIFEEFYKESKEREVSELKLKALMQGRTI